MNSKQPWVHSWYGDILAFFTIPFVFIFLATFNLAPFRPNDSRLLEYLIITVLIIDWAHIFAQYPRIFFNPLETKLMKWVYPLSYILLVLLITLGLEFSSIDHIETALVYFVIYHFIKQQFGFIKIYSKTDGSKTKLQLRVEDTFVYLSMFTPVVYWHVTGFDYDYKWINFFFKIPILNDIFPVMGGGYFIFFLAYLYLEVKRSVKNKSINIPKNLAILSAILGWGLVSFLSKSPFLIIFTVTLTHDISYTFLVWFTGRRDAKYLQGRNHFFSLWSLPGFIIYFSALVLFSHVIMIVHLELSQDRNWNYWIYGTAFNFLKQEPGLWTNFGWSLFFATQAHHYFIDRYLWKKEKDLEYMVKTGRYTLS